jgi:hypothetical protein
VQTQGSATARNKIVLSIGTAALLLASCSKPAPKVTYAPPVPASGHVYPVAIEVPPPVSSRVKFTASQQQQIQQAFNVIGLKSALMVAALSCGQQDKYDTFMTSFQPHVLAAQHVMDAYFRKVSGGRNGQKAEDNFVTLLANNQSVSGIAQGSTYCLNNTAEFNAVLALKTPQALDSFVTNQAPPSASKVASAAPTP